MYQLVIMDARQRKRSVPLRPGSYRIGSDASCEIRLGGGGVCALHAVLHDRLGGLSIAVLEDGAGLSVNGVPVTETKLKAGDTLQLGPYQMAVQSRRGHGRHRSVHPIQVLAVAAVLALFGVQSIVLLRFSARRQNPIAADKPDVVTTNAAGDTPATPFHVPMSHTNDTPVSVPSTNAESVAESDIPATPPATNMESKVESSAPPAPASTNPVPTAATNATPDTAITNAPAAVTEAPTPPVSTSTNTPPPATATNPPPDSVAQPPTGD